MEIPLSVPPGRAAHTAEVYIHPHFLLRSQHMSIIEHISGAIDNFRNPLDFCPLEHALLTSVCHGNWRLGEKIQAEQRLLGYRHRDAVVDIYCMNL